MLIGIVDRVEARVRIAQLGRPDHEVVQQRVLPRTHHVGVMRNVPGTVEIAVRITPLGGAVESEVLQWLQATDDHIRIAGRVPFRIEKSAEGIAQAGYRVWLH